MQVVAFLAMWSKEVEASPSSSTRWWSNSTVAIVTGANKGIGFALVKRLAELGLTVILTCRDVSRGHKAVQSLRAQGFHVDFFLLDVSDPASINTFASWFREKFGALDILVNNAAVSFNDIGKNSVEHAETVMKTNFYGSKLLTETLLPLFCRSVSKGRILNISSRLGLLNVSNSTVREILEDEEGLSEARIEEIVSWFLEDVKRGVWEEKGWPKLWTDYSVSKLALNAYSRLLANRYEGCGLSVNCFCPGFTQTAMTRGKGVHTAEAAAEIGAKLVLLPPGNLPTGKFYIGCNPFLYSKL
ncbi:hypothetical protein HHK36_019983 [Tetracentron sinense]|uniref:Uncharacterized protein n=1 Tax=Tetracentron sinense TaxID=13715 RepID=A0A834YT93_TETSI|nr:hypothetical protein HHK36_019983 [Tetracentron sinense]